MLYERPLYDSIGRAMSRGAQRRVNPRIHTRPAAPGVRRSPEIVTRARPLLLSRPPTIQISSNKCAPSHVERRRGRCRAIDGSVCAAHQEAEK